MNREKGKYFTALWVSFLITFFWIARATSAPLWYVTQGTGGNYTQNEGHLYTWDPLTNDITDKGYLNRGAWADIAWGNGKLYGLKWENGVYGGGTKLYEITPGDASNFATFTAISEHYSQNFNALGWDNGVMWSGQYNDTNTYRWDFDTVLDKWVAHTFSDTFDSGGDYATASDGTVFGTSWDQKLFTVDKVTGQKVQVGADTQELFFGIGFDSDTLYGFSASYSSTGFPRGYGGDSDIYTIDTTTGDIASFFDLGTGVNVWGAASFSSPVPTPEPGTLLLLGSGLAGLGFFRRRRKTA